MVPILQEEQHYWIVNKPAGLFTQAAPNIDSLEVQLAEQIKQRDAHAGKPFIGLPHRLDRGTSGVLLVARNQRALKRFGQQFQSRKVGKFYLAVVEGALDRQDFHWQDYVRKVTDQPLAEIVDNEEDGGRLALIDAHSIVNEQQKTLLLIQLHTGRMHQIRVQAASRGWPVVGDAVYGARTSFSGGSAELDPRQAAFALHALRIEFRHPQNGLATSGTATLPEGWQCLPESILASAQELVEKSRREARESWQPNEGVAWPSS